MDERNDLLDEPSRFIECDQCGHVTTVRDYDLGEHVCERGE